MSPPSGPAGSRPTPSARAGRRRAAAPTHRRARSRSSGSRSGPGRAPRRPSAPRRARSRARSSGHRRARPRGRRGVTEESGSSSSLSCRSSSWSCRPAATYFPTNSVTTVFGSCWLLPTGSWEITTPSNVSTSVSCFVTFTLNPAAFRVAVASACVWPVTSGSGVVCGPFETDRLTVEPLVAVDDPLGTWLTYDPRRLRALDVGARDREACGLELLERRRVVEADHGRHGHLLRPRRVVDADGRTLDEGGAGSRILGRHGAGRLVRGHADALRVQACPRERRDGVRQLLADDVRARRRSSCPSRP